MKKNTRNNLILLFIFGIGMGFFEAIVVLYLRHIYYPDGFRFPLVMLSSNMYMAELIREVCTIVMLLSISIIAGKNRLQILAFFFFSFAIWDVFYYIALKLFLNWPHSLMTWDVLFLIPITWLSPVLAPVLCSITMIVFSVLILYIQDREITFKIKPIEWMLVFLGFLFVFMTFIWDSAKILISSRFIRENFIQEQSPGCENFIWTHVPYHYHWLIFILGIFCIYFSIYLILKRTLFRDRPHNQSC